MSDHGTPVAEGLRVEHGPSGTETWWIDNPARRNAITPAALQWIGERCMSLRGEVVVLRGVGDRSFCAGFDLTALAEPPPPGTFPDQPLLEATSAMRMADATLVAAIGGYAIGAGVELACACDLRIATRDIFFAIPAAELGVVYHAHGLTTIRTVFGPAITRRLVLLGERVGADDAWHAGALVKRVAAEQLDLATKTIVEQLRGGAPLSIAGNRDLLRSIERGPLTDAALREHDARRRTAYTSDDHKEARAARVERRAPKFHGR